MNFEAELLNDRSKENIQALTDYIIQHPDTLVDFMQLLDVKNTSESQYRAAWVLGYLAPLGAKPFEPHFNHLIHLLDTPELHPTIHRSITRLFQYFILPEDHHGKIIDVCFNILASEEHLSAQRANCMTILHNYTKIYPEICQELDIVISEILEYKKDPALQSRGKKVLNTLRKKS